MSTPTIFTKRNPEQVANRRTLKALAAAERRHERELAALAGDPPQPAVALRILPAALSAGGMAGAGLLAGHPSAAITALSALGLAIAMVLAAPSPFANRATLTVRGMLAVAAPVAVYLTLPHALGAAMLLLGLLLVAAVVGHGCDRLRNAATERALGRAAHGAGCTAVRAQADRLRAEASASPGPSRTPPSLASTARCSNGTPPPTPRNGHRLEIG